MASNLERLKAKKASNQKKETDLSTSFSIDSGEEEKKEAVTKPDIAAETKEKEAEKPKDNLKKEIPAAEDKAIKDIIPIKAINNSKEYNNISISKETDSRRYTRPEKNLGIRLASEEDKRYLNMIPLSRSMTKKAFFIKIMEEEFENTKTIDINDPEVEKFRNNALKTASMTISVPEDLIEDIKKYSAKHMMKPQRYIAYVLNKTRKSDSAWK